MILPRPRTVRAKLTLFTMLVTGVLLGLIVLIVDLGARRTLVGAVEGELLRLSRRLTNRPPRGPFGPDGRGGGGEGTGRGGVGRGGPFAGFESNGRFPRGAMGSPPGPLDPPNPRGPAPDPDEMRPLDFPVDQPDGVRPPRAYDPDAVARAKRGIASFSDFQRGEKTYRLYTFPIKRDGEIIEVVQAPSELTEVLRSLDGLRRTLLQVVLPIGVLLAGLASLLLVDRFMRPLRRISGDAERIHATELSARLPVVGEDEFAGLATTLNGMLGRLEEAFRKERGELERQRQFTADASHELKTPLAVIKANAGLMLHVGGSPEETREWTGEIDAATNRMTRLVNDMLVLARAEAGATRDFAPCDLREVAEAARRQLGAGEDRLRLNLTASPIPVLGSAEDLTRVVVNLAGNALKHSGTTTPVEIMVRTVGDEAEVIVTDHGKGIAPEHLPRLFDRFYRVDASRSSDTGGSGLGLAICKSLVETHAGSISAQSGVGEGSKFTVRLPLSEASLPRAKTG